MARILTHHPGRALLVAVVCGAAVLSSPSQLAAMEIEQFDRMAVEDQRHYLAFLAKEAQALLLEQGRRDLAVKVYHLFHDIPPGESRPAGEVHFEKELAAARAYSARVKMDGKVSWNQIEFVLFQTLYKNGIRPPLEFYKRLPEVTRNRVFYQRPE